MPHQNARYAVIVSLAAVLGIFEAPAELEAESSQQLIRETFIQMVLDQNPSVEAARQAWQAALERYPQATTLEDPVLSYGFSPASISEPDSRYGQVLAVSQRLPFPGKLRLQGVIAKAEAEAAHEDLQTVRLDLATIASLFFDDYYVVHRALEINEEHVQLLEDFKRIATAQYAAGEASQQDPILAEVELAHLSHRQLILQSTREVLVAQINTLLHRRPEGLVPQPPSNLPLPLIPLEKTEKLQEEALSIRPELRSNSARIRGGQAAVDLEKKDFFPDFEARTSFNSMWNMSEHRWVVGVAVNLPIQRKRIRAGIAEAKAELIRIENQHWRLEDQIRSEVQKALVRLREAHHVIELYRNRLLPAAHDQVQAALSGFRTGQDSFLVLIEAEKNQRSVELSYHESLAEVHRRTAELDRASGRIPGRGGSRPLTNENAG